jgi:hypothetical protein
VVLVVLVVVVVVAVRGPSSTFGAGDSALSPDCAEASAIGCVGSASFAW